MDGNIIAKLYYCLGVYVTEYQKWQFYVWTS